MAVVGHELLVIALFEQAAVLKNDNPVGAANGGEAVGDDDAGAVADGGTDGPFDENLGGGVDPAAKRIDLDDYCACTQPLGFDHGTTQKT